jgi:hypothetical protein
VKELSSCINAEDGKLLIRGVHHLRESRFSRRDRFLLRLLVIQGGLRRAVMYANFGMPIGIGDFGPRPPLPRPTELSRPPSNANRGKESPISDQKRPGPPVPAFHEPESDPDPGVTPSEQPLCPESDQSAANDSCADVEPGGKGFSIELLFVRMSEAVRWPLCDFARKDEQRREEEPCEEGSWDERQLEDEEGRR